MGQGPCLEPCSRVGLTGPGDMRNRTKSVLALFYLRGRSGDCRLIGLHAA